MKKIISVGIVTILALGLTGCTWFQSTEPTVEQPPVTEEPTSDTLEVKLDATTKKVITPEWDTLDNGAPIAKDPETGKLYVSNEVGEYYEYLPDVLVPPTYECPTADDPVMCMGLSMSNEPPHPDSRCYGEGQKWVAANCPGAEILE